MEYSIHPAKYAKGQMIVRCPSTTGYKTRAARLIGDGLNCRYIGRSAGYAASPSKAAKFEALYAAGFDACAFSGELWHPERGFNNISLAEALNIAKAELSDDIGQLPHAAQEPATASIPETAVERHDPPAPCASAGEAQNMAAIEPAGDIIADLLRRVADLEARLAAPAVESEPSSLPNESYAGAAEICHSEPSSSPETANANPTRRTPSRERLLRRYLAMRAQRDLDRRALEASVEHVRKIQHRNDPDPGLVAQLHDERQAHRLTRENAERRAAAQERAVEKLAAELLDVKGRAIRAEQALQLYRRPALAILPYGDRSGAVARVSFGEVQ